MQKRYVSIWFRHLKTDWIVRHQPRLKEAPFALAQSQQGRMCITEVSANAKKEGLKPNITVADARAILPHVEVMDDKEQLAEQLLRKLCHWLIQYTPIVAVDLPNGIILDATGCTHLWGGEKEYLKTIAKKLKALGYHVRIAMADTIGTAWAVARYGKIKAIIPSGEQTEAIRLLPPAALRLDTAITERLHKIGMHRIGSFLNIPRSQLRRRFGDTFLLQLDYALGTKEEFVIPVQPPAEYVERLPCPEPIAIRKGIEIALERLLNALCQRLIQDGKGLRTAILKGYRLDHKLEQVSISVNHPSNSADYLFTLFELHIHTIEPGLGIELFTLEANGTEKTSPLQETFWTTNSSLQSKEIVQLLSSLQIKFGNHIVHRYLPDEHHLPERSIHLSSSLQEAPTTEWRTDKRRPIQLLHKPEPIQVSAPIPDYPPINFRYKNKLHIVAKADACERIEPEWWLEGGLHRDYYIVEDEEGKRYWVFRLGHYEAEASPLWFIHGFFE